MSSHLDVITTREPGGTATAEAVRSLVLTASDATREPSTDAFLMNAARRDHCRRVVAPALARGAVVMSDRFAASTLAYQGSGDGLPHDWLRALEQLATDGLSPNRYLLFDLDAEVGLARRLRGGELNVIDRRDLGYHRRVRDGYRQLAADQPDTWTVIDAAADEEAVWLQVKVALAAELILAAIEPPA